MIDDHDGRVGMFYCIAVKEISSTYLINSPSLLDLCVSIMSGKTTFLFIHCIYSPCISLSCFIRL